ncbi:MAG: tetratricopeptide repeat protein, partial [Nitrosarchaeum sp.]
MTRNPKTDSLLDEANRLFLKGNLKEAIIYYDKILHDDPNHIGSLNNKGYVLNKLKDYDGAIQCYDRALQLDSTDLSVLVNKISSLRKKGGYAEALNYCNAILKKNQNYNIVL